MISHNEELLLILVATETNFGRNVEKDNGSSSCSFPLPFSATIMDAVVDSRQYY